MRTWLQCGFLCALCGLLFPPAVSAQTVVCQGPASDCARAADQLRFFLAVGVLLPPASGQEAPRQASDWTWKLLDAAAWARITEAFRQQANIDQLTGSAFTWLDGRTTYVHLAYFLRALFADAFRTVLHELAHITLCRTDESCARREASARFRLFMKGPGPAAPCPPAKE